MREWDAVIPVLAKSLTPQRFRMVVMQRVRAVVIDVPLSWRRRVHPTAGGATKTRPRLEVGFHPLAKVSLLGSVFSQPTEPGFLSQRVDSAAAQPLRVPTLLPCR